jgi:hypothetical protein
MGRRYDLHTESGRKDERNIPNQDEINENTGRLTGQGAKI